MTLLIYGDDVWPRYSGFPVSPASSVFSILALMRKQYYFLPSKNGYYAWDVDKLVEKSKDLPVISINLEDIKELDESFWYQGGNQPSCRSIVEHVRLVNEADLKYPIILSKDGRVMDGMHRVAKALLLGHDEIQAVRFDEDIAPDYEDVFEDDLPYEESLD